MPLLVKMAGKPVVAVSGIGVAPRRATVEFYSHRQPESWEDPGHMPPIPGEGIKAAITPGVFDGIMLALQQYGTMSFAQVAAPAIEYADQGFPIAEEFATFLNGYKRILDLWPASQAFFYPTGRRRNGATWSACRRSRRLCANSPPPRKKRAAIA